LRAELLAAEQEARHKRKKLEGRFSPIEDASADDEANKRRKLLHQALELDRDDDEEDEEGKDVQENGEEEEGNDRYDIFHDSFRLRTSIDNLLQ
jgi:protein CWC15